MLAGALLVLSWSTVLFDVGDVGEELALMFQRTLMRHVQLTRPEAARQRRLWRFGVGSIGIAFGLMPLMIGLFIVLGWL